MSSEKKINNVSWSCSPLKNKLENFTNGCSGPVCGLPYIKAGLNCNDDQIAIFNKMVADARDCCVNPNPKNLEPFVPTLMVDDKNKALPNNTIPLSNNTIPLSNNTVPLSNNTVPLPNVNKSNNINLNKPLPNVNLPLQNKNIPEKFNNISDSNNLFGSYDSNSYFESNLYNYKLLN
jgi:hypothetical protein